MGGGGGRRETLWDGGRRETGGEEGRGGGGRSGGGEMVLALDGMEEVVEGKAIVEVVVELIGSTTLFLLITVDYIFCHV